MKFTLTALSLLFSVAAFSATIQQTITTALPTGIYQSRNCAVRVLAEASSVEVEVGAQGESVSFHADESDSRHSLISDLSTAKRVDLTVRSRVRAYESYTEVLKLEIEKNVVTVSKLVRGISGRMNTIKTLSCKI